MGHNSSPASAASMERIPSLDGLRALSIFLVVALHTIQRYSAHHDVATVWYGIFNSSTGVLIFFVISGYLITRLLLNDHRKRGSISLRGFYFRRAMRILPPLYAYVAVLLILGGPAISRSRSSISSVRIAPIRSFPRRMIPDPKAENIGS